jgi:hypothetical protein
VSDDVLKILAETSHLVSGNGNGHVPDDAWAEELAVHGFVHPVEDLAAARRLVVQPWRQFAQETPAEIAWLIPGLIALGAFVFVASPPKKGKTWTMLDLALAIVLAATFLARFQVETPRPVLLVLLEGNRTALRDRIGALARGHGVDPDGPELDQLHIAYKPRGINLADPGWAAALRDEANDLDAACIGVDVLRAAARLKNENDPHDFLSLRDNLLPILDDGRTLVMAHHFGKLTELSKERDPGERMSGSGAMYGAMDLGIFITGSSQGARRLRLEFDGRDLALPDPIGLRLTGTGTGEHGSFTYDDACHVIADTAPPVTELKAPPSEIADWIRARGGEATPGEILEHFEIAEGTLRDRRDDLERLGIHYEKAGKGSRYIDLEDPALSITYPAPADPAPLRVSALRGQKPLEQAKSTPQPADPAAEALREAKSGDLQDNPLTRNPALSYGESPPHCGVHGDSAAADASDASHAREQVVTAGFDEDIPF